MSNAHPKVGVHPAVGRHPREETLLKVVDNRAEKYRQKAVMTRKRAGVWESLSWLELSQMYREVARGLLDMGLKRGDRIAILSENRPEWAFADLGTFAMEGVVVPLYWTLTPAQIEFILRDCEASAVFVSNEDYLRRILKVKDSLPGLKSVIHFDPVPAELRVPGVVSFGDLLESGRNAAPEIWESLGRSIAEGRGEDLATIIYTSGTTGEPKGVMLTHDNFLSNVRAVLESIRVTDQDHCLSFLPLSHVFERIAYYLFLYVGGRIAYAESIDTVVANLSEVHPTILVSVPRIYEKAYGRILDRVREASSLRRGIFVASLGIGRKVSKRQQRGLPLGGKLAFQKRLADGLVFGKVRQSFGGNIRLMISGGAPLSKRIAEFFHAAGLLILEGYGLTETSPVVSANREERYRFGTVGPPIPGVEVRIAPDGEILVRGPNVMKGYYNRPVDTAEAIDGDGWFYTGDIGHFDEDGFLVITDRKKAIIVTAAGKNIAPAAIENALCTDKFISQAFACGDARHYIAALIVPDWERMEQYASEHKIAFESRDDLCGNQKINEFFRQRVDQALKDLSRAEQVRRFRLLPREFTQEDGEVTPTLKLKRKEITQRYWKQIEGLYRD